MFGYGIDLDTCKLKKEANKLLEELVMKTKKTKETYLSYSIDRAAYPDMTDMTDMEFEKELRDSRIEAYENDIHIWGDFEGLLADVINETEFGTRYGESGRTFYLDAGCLAVLATVPKDDEERAKLLTQKEIRDILTKYLNIFAEEPEKIEVKWIQMPDD